MTPRRFMNYLYMWVAERIKPEEWVRFEEELYRPMSGQHSSREEERLAEEEWEAFQQMAGLMG